MGLPAGGTIPCVFSLAGPVLSEAERSLFRESDPAGFILFARNCENREQLRTLTDSLKEAVGRDCPILIDQEGGRVQRMKPPVWRAIPAMRTFGEMAEKEGVEAAQDALRFEILRMAEELTEAGITVNCTPVLDVLSPKTHDVIGDRAFGDDPDIISALALTVCETLLDSGVTPVIKHIPGHGRAAADSHFELPVVEADRTALEKDFAPFRTLSQSPVGPLLWAMTAHVIYPALDTDLPATLSPRIIRDVIRKEIGFQGLLIGDDLDMKALAQWGGPAERALACLDAGCDLALYCAGELKVMEELAGALPKSGGLSRAAIA